MKKIISFLLAVLLCIGITACGATPAAAPAEPLTTEASVPASDPEETVAPVTDEADGASDGAYNEWTICLYLCGSDLESGGGAATTDLQEIMEVSLPEGVNVIIQTGGASVWQNEFVDASLLQRWIYNSEGMSLVDEQPSASMGDAQTLADFLAYANTNYPADKMGVVFWNHGGGSVSGAAFDEIYDSDSLKLDEMYAAFTSVFTPSTEAQPLEFVGFDTCLMATVDVAYTFSDLAHYLVGSEEVEPGNGWYYTGWLQTLADDPTIDGEVLGRAICDSYYTGCEMVGTEQSVTLSLTDLTKAQPLFDAYEAYGKECLVSACTNTSFFTQFARAAAASENYGGNTKEQGYTNMVDLGDLARKSSDVTTFAQEVLTALEGCVLYTVNGPYRAEASGLSCYYSYNGDTEDFGNYANLGVGEAFKYFFEYELTGELGENGLAYIADDNLETLSPVKSLADMGWDNMNVDLAEDGVSFMTLGPDASEVLTSVYFQLFYYDEENDIMMLLGSDNVSA